MLVAGIVDVVDHRRQGGGLTGTGGPGNQHNAPWHLGNLLEHLAHAQVFHGQHFRGNGPEYRTGAPVVVEGVDPETGHAGHLEGEVGFEEFLEVLALLVVHDVVDQPMDFFMLHWRKVDAADIAINTDHRGKAGRQVQV